MQVRSILVAAFSFCCAVAPTPVVMAFPDDDLDASDVAANAAFIYLLKERRMYDRFFSSEKSATSAGRAVCDMTAKSMPIEVVDSVTGRILGLPADNAGVGIFEALSIRTFCPPSPAERSY